MQISKKMPTNIFSLTGIRIFNTFSIQSCFLEIEEKFATKWGSFENILSENGENFVLK